MEAIERRFGWEDMWVAPDEDPRKRTPSHGERETLSDYLQSYRLTFRLKCDGLTPEQMARRSVPPSNMSLLGLVRHLTDAERHWFRRVLSGEDVPNVFRTEDDGEAAFEAAVGDQACVDEAWAAWREEVAFAETFVEGAADLGATFPFMDAELELRDILVHMIEEYARHCGHADLLRECIDGRVGQ